MDWQSYVWGPRTWLERVHDLPDDREVSRDEIAPGLQRVELSLDRNAMWWGEEDEAEFETICKRYKMQSSLGKRSRRWTAHG